MPSLGATASSAPIRLTAAMGLLVLSGFCAWILLAACHRLVRLIPAPWQEAVCSGLPSLRFVVFTLALLACTAPFLWRDADGTIREVADGVRTVTASLPALKEFGKVEEITLTYVVVALWDQRRLIVPLSHIIENPFENWTRTATELLGTVTLRCDYAVPVADVRAKTRRFIENHRLWDKRVFAVQVTDCDHRTIEVRVLVSAAAAGPLFELRCETSEHLLAWLNRIHPQALPRIHLMQSELPLPALAGGT